jgi:hypothetical protein
MPSMTGVCHLEAVSEHVRVGRPYSGFAWHAGLGFPEHTIVVRKIPG